MPKHITYLLTGVFWAFLIGIVAGWQLSKHHLKPLMIAEHRQKVFVDAENKRLQKSYAYFAIEIEGCKQFMDKAISMRIIRKLGLEGQFGIN